MDHVPVRQVVGPGDHGLSRTDRGERPALRLEARARGPVDRAGDAPARSQRAVRRVDYGVDARLRGDIAPHAFDRDPAVLTPDHGGCSRAARAAAAITIQEP